MKKLFVLCSFLLVSAIGYSQKVIGTFTIPESEKFISLAWDWSAAVIDKKYSEAEWASVVGEEYWEQAKTEVLKFIAREMNSKMDRARISVLSPDSERKTAYTLYICPDKYNKKGTNNSFYILKENSTGQEIGKCMVNGDGGKIGTVANFLGDGYEEAARKIGRILMKYNMVK